MDYNHVVKRIGEVIDGAGVTVIVVGGVIAAGAATVGLSHHEAGTYRRFRQQLGPGHPAGPGVAGRGDIVRTVATEPTLTSVAVLAIIVLIRTFLSFSLEVELKGRWLWQQITAVPPAAIASGTGPGRQSRKSPCTGTNDPPGPVASRPSAPALTRGYDRTGQLAYSTVW
jgi:uncharacterized membrane protein